MAVKHHSAKCSTGFGTGDRNEQVPRMGSVSGLLLRHQDGVSRLPAIIPLHPLRFGPLIHPRRSPSPGRNFGDARTFVGGRFGFQQGRSRLSGRPGGIPVGSADGAVSPMIAVPLTAPPGQQSYPLRGLRGIRYAERLRTSTVMLRLSLIENARSRC